MNDNSSAIDPEAEVKKLQDLVKKLEQQNQILRSKQNQRDNNSVISTKSEDINTNFTRTSRTDKDGTDNLKASLGNLTLEDIEILDIEDVVKEDEDDNW